MSPCPPDEQKLRSMCVELVAYLANRKAGQRAIGVVEYLFAETIRGRTVISGQHIINTCPGARTNRSVIALVSRLRLAMRQFFEDSPQGRDYRCQAVIPTTGNYVLAFESHTPRLKETDLRPIFWGPYLVSSDNKILFPEPLFHIDEEGTYLRNPRANMFNHQEVYAYLNPPGKLETSYSFLPAGIVNGILHVLSAFAEFKHGFTMASPFKPWEGLPDQKDNLIILGTPTSAAMTAAFEENMPVRCYASGIESRMEGADPETFSDGVEKQGDSVVRMVKWGLLTRCRRPREHKQDQVITLLSARHGRAVEAMTRFLANKTKLETLAEKLQHTNSFPQQFQALFRVRMNKAPDGPSFQDDDVELKLAVSIPDPEDAVNIVEAEEIETADSSVPDRDAEQ